MAKRLKRQILKDSDIRFCLCDECCRIMPARLELRKKRAKTFEVIKTWPI